ncbi:HAD domain-containing protein [Halomonas sp. A11-A]|uniref:HAD domain-containing protein n=1 Tax=Halomonas sp. A11-A TaxID=2183985 RepID=UPI001C63DEC1|nr:HAD domain-containing protein [Halomonas sp. A11-A]
MGVTLHQRKSILLLPLRFPGGISTSWVRNIGFHRARKALPVELAAKVVGATWHSAMGKGWPDYIPWDNQTRYEQIKAYLARLSAPHPHRWIAVDDDAQGWANAELHRLIQTDPNLGLSAPETLAALACTLEEE